MSDHEDNHEEFELAFWGDCTITFGEESKQYSYASNMNLIPSVIMHTIPFPLDKPVKVLDIGGGPVSMLLKTTNYAKGSTVIDPLMDRYPQWVRDRYESKGIKCLKGTGETLIDVIDDSYDEVWMYNVLQHTEDPKLIIENMKKVSPRLRIFEWIDIPPHPGHPHMLTEMFLNECVGSKGRVGKMIPPFGCLAKFWSYYPGINFS